MDSVTADRRGTAPGSTRPRWGWALVCMTSALLGTPTAAATLAPDRTVVVVAGGSRALEATKMALARLRAEEPRIALTLADARTLAIARAELLLGGELARLYAQSAFARCVEEASLAERRLAPHVRSPTDLERLKRINQWIGLSLEANGAREPARTAFELASRLPGPDPDLDLFPPRVLEVYRSAQQSARQQRCVMKQPSGVAPFFRATNHDAPATTELAIDGRKVAPQQHLAAGDHYLQWTTTGGENRSARVRIEAPVCSLLPSVSGAPTDSSGATDARGTVPLAQVRSAAFLQAIGQVAKASHVIGINLQPGVVEVAQLDAARAEIGKQVRAVVPADHTASDVLGRQIRLLRGLPRIPTAQPLADTTLAPPHTLAPTASQSPRAQPRRWYERWWVWTLIGAGVTAAVAVPLVLTLGNGNDPTGQNPVTRYEIVF